MSEADLLASRRQKLLRLRAQGVAPYPYSYSRTHTTHEVRSAFGSLGPNIRTATSPPSETYDERYVSRREIQTTAAPHLWRLVGFPGYWPLGCA